ncbi:MAG: hypothetical protein ABSB70_21610 [Candidatus Velthaea sp.]
MSAEHVSSPPEWLGKLVDGGTSVIYDRYGTRIERLVLREGAPVTSITGTICRSSPVSRSVSLVARSEAGEEIPIPAWCFPSADSKEITFGANLCAGDLPPGRYRLFACARDASQRFTGRADTGCDLIVGNHAAF